MARLTKQQEVEKYCVGKHVYSFKIVYEHFDMNVAVLAATEAEAEKTLAKQYKGFKNKDLIFISNRILPS